MAPLTHARARELHHQDCVFQLWDYSPHQFQFNDSFLIFLIDSVYNGTRRVLL
jgi:hypothetical protein